VAEQVGQLALRIGQAAKNIDDGITQAAQQVEQALMERFNGENAKVEQDRMNQANEQFKMLKGHYCELLQFNQSSVATLGDFHHKAAGSLLTLIASLQFQDIVRQRVEQVISTLNRKRIFMEKLAREGADPGALSPEELTLDVGSFVKDYVMAQQRQVHRGVTGGKGAVATVEEDITLF
ncbi:MAG: hypothetical protein HQL51_12235, partial [Magnetococcales bacterium]|nr:hypothetical protein [Magnetococcales bacterium]